MAAVGFWLSLFASGVCLATDAAAPQATPRASSPPSSQAAASPASPRSIYRYHPPVVRVPPSLESVLKQLEPGHDAFPEEKEAAEFAVRLGELSAHLRDYPARGAVETAVDALLAPDFKGSRLTTEDESAIAVAAAAGAASGASAGARSQPLEIVRTPTASAGTRATLDRVAFRQELAGLVRDFASIETAEFLITAITVQREPVLEARTTVRFDLTGPAKRGWRAEHVGHWQLRWRHTESWRIVEWIAVDQLRSRSAIPVFTEVTQSALGGNASFREQLLPGLDAWASRLDAVFMPRGMGHHGVSVADVDGDGLDDIYVSQPEGLPNRLFRNRGDGTFEDITASSGLGLLDRTSQALFADIDNDGDEDAILLTRLGAILYVNDGKAHFTRQTDAFRFAQPLQGSLTSAALADFDRDGFIDIYLCAYGYFIGVSEDKAGPPSPYHDALNGSPNILLRNDGHGHFIDVTHDVGLDENNDRFSFAAVWADYDEDGWPDLLVSNDFGRKNLYHNEGMIDGHVRFKDVAAAAGVADYGAGMSAAFLDYDNDGHMDIYTGNMWTAAGQRITASAAFKPDATPELREIYRRHARGNGLFRNRGDGTFSDETLASHAEFGRWAWASDALDFDNDGWQDLYIVNGMFTREKDEPGVDVDSFFWRQVVAQSPLVRTPGTTYDDGWRATNRLLVSDGAQAQHERNVLLRNNGRGGFDEVSGAVGLDVDQDGRAFAVFDYDDDGDADLVLMAPRSSPQVRIYRNDFATGHASIAMHLIGTKSNRDAIGARVTVETDKAARFTRTLIAGSGFLSQHSKTLLFGLGDATRIEHVTIVWPSGATQILTDVPINHRVTVEEGEEAARPVSAVSRERGMNGTPAAPAAAERAASRALDGGSPAASAGASDNAASRGDGAAGRSDGVAPLAMAGEHALTITTGPEGGAVGAASSLATAAQSRAARERGIVRAEPFRKASVPPAAGADVNGGAGGGRGADGAAIDPRPGGTWLYEPVPAPGFTLRDQRGEEHTLSAQAQAGRAVVLMFWSAAAPPSRALLEELSRGRDALSAAGAIVLAPSVDSPAAAAAPSDIAIPAMIAGDDVAGTYNILHRYLFDRREDLRLPTTFLINARSEIVKIYSGATTTAHIVDDLRQLDASAANAGSTVNVANATSVANDATADENARLARAAPFPGTFSSPPEPRNYFQYGLELSEQGFDAPALAAFERVAKSDPSALAFYNLGTLYMKAGRPQDARAALDRALSMKADYAEAHNTLGALLAQSGDLPNALAHFRAALDAKPAYADALNNLGYALFQAGQTQQAYELYQRALQLQPDFPEALNNVGIYFGQQRNYEQAEHYFRQAVDQRPTYGEAANNLALVLGARGDGAGAIALLERLLKDNPTFEPAYVTLCRLYVAAGETRDGLQVLERLLQRNPSNPQGLQLLHQLQPAR